MSTYNVVDVMGYPVFCDQLDNVKISEKIQVINTLNAYSYVVARKDLAFRKALLDSDILVPDGFPVVLAARMLRHRKIIKIAGEDIFLHFCHRLNDTGGRCFFLGASSETLQLIHNRMAADFPNIQISSFSPPYRKSFSPEESMLMVEKINAFSPDVLFVGMTAPKQEKWTGEFKDQIKAGAICSIGAVFDFYAQTTKRPSAFWIKLNLEWLIRLLKEPKRLWKRYLVYSPLFFLDMILYEVTNQSNHIK